MNIYGSIAIFIGLTVSIFALLTLTFGNMTDDPETLIDTTVGARYRAYPNTLTNPSHPVCEAHTIINATEETMQWRVAGHTDADTITVAPINGKLEPIATIDLWGMDAPEHGQPYAEMSLLALQQLLPKGATITLYPVHNDAFRYLIGSADTAGQSVQLLMIGNGWAFVDITNPDAAFEFCLNRFEDIATKNHSGLWQFMPHGGERPWQYRQEPE